jgi:hypothetical protein
VAWTPDKKGHLTLRLTTSRASDFAVVMRDSHLIDIELGPRTKKTR